LEYTDKIRDVLIRCQQKDQAKYDFEQVMDECGFVYFENSQFSKKINEGNLFSLWKIEFG
jgi:hypothetical protein